MFKKKADPSQLAAVIISDTNTYIDPIGERVDDFCATNSVFKKNAALLKDELQYYIVVGGLIAVSKLSNDEYAIRTLDSYIAWLQKTHEHNKGKSPYDNDNLLGLKAKLARYFNSYVIKREWNPDESDAKRFQIALANTSLEIVDICEEAGVSMNQDEVGLLTFPILKEMTEIYIDKFKDFKITA